jgi:hypothetical protein
MSATASFSDSSGPARRSNVGEAIQPGGAELANPAVLRTVSLSVIREAFDGLLANTERTLRSDTDHAVEHSELTSLEGQVPNAFQEEAYSYRAVQESRTDISSSAFEPRIARESPRGIAQTSSVEFFDYLIAIGAV